MANQVDISPTKVEVAMKQRLSDCHASPARAPKFTDELQVVQGSFKCLMLVLSGSEEELKSYIQALVDACEESEGAASSHASDLVALARVGPCEGFEKLKAIGVFLTRHTSYLLCSTQEERDDAKKRMDPLKALYGVLAATCFQAVRDVNQAEKVAAADLEKQQAVGGRPEGRQSCYCQGCPSCSQECSKGEPPYLHAYKGGHFQRFSPAQVRNRAAVTSARAPLGSLCQTWYG